MRDIKNEQNPALNYNLKFSLTAGQSIEHVNRRS